MIKNGLPFDVALKQAQEKGYAEGNPSSDINGTDACRKICILADLSFGRHVSPEQVKTIGIGAVSLDDLTIAGSSGYKIKLLGRAVALDGGKVSAYVAPHLVSSENLLSSVEGVMNAIVVRGNAIGDVMFYGAGAGKLPTASAVVADVIDAAKHEHARKYIEWGEGSPDYAVDSAALESRWYVRAQNSEGEISGVFQDAEILGTISGATAFLTGVLSKTRVSERLTSLGALSVFRVLE
jgi:homoserine dehydrogenase